MYSRAVRSLLTIQVFLLAVGPAVGQGGASAPPALGCPPQLVWQQSYGGSGFDQLEVARTTSDGGFVLAGYSDSTDGDRQAVTHGRYDYWVARCDADRAVLWEKSYGGTANDILADVAETADGGFLLGGYSYSEPGGSKTAPKFGPSNREDYWVVRISSTGEQLWERSFGGTGGDRLMRVIQTGDGGFALGGSSTSGAEGNKTSANFDTNSPATADFWLVRLDPEGNKLWEGSYGGSHHDVMTSVRETGDGGFVLGGYSRSPADGTRTAPGMFSDFQDFWVTKVDSNGVPVWDRAFGGSDFDMAWCMEVLPDGGIYLGGPSGSSTGQSKSSPFFGVADWWLLRLDASGALVWERAFGGVGGDELNALAVTPDGGVVLAGSSQSGPGPGKGGAAYGMADGWVVRLNAAGTLVWESSYGGLDTDELRDVDLTPDGGVLLGGISASQPRGNKTAPLLGYYDFWVLKLAAETPDDCDGDGVLNGIDLCPDTGFGEVTDANGCSIAQHCPCNDPWESPVHYVDCVRAAAAAFRSAGLIDLGMETALIAEAESGGCPPELRFVVAFGLTNVLLGEVVLGGNSSESFLHAAEAGPGGTDGFSIQLGESDGGVFVDPDAAIWGSYDPNWYLEEIVYGQVDGVEREVSRMRGRKIDYQIYPVEIDFSALEPAGLTYQVFSNTTLIAEISTTDGCSCGDGRVANVTVVSGTSVAPRVNPFWRMADGTIGALIDFTAIDPNGYGPPYFDGPFGQVEGDRLFIRVENPSRHVRHVSRADVVLGGDLRQFSILDERVGMYGRSHRALGDALFRPAGGRLHLSTPSELSGVMADSMRENDLSVAFLPVLLTNESSVFHATVSGFLTDQSDQLAQFTLANRTNTLELMVGFPATDPLLEARVYRNGVLAGFQTVTNGASFGWVGDGEIPGIVAIGYHLGIPVRAPRMNATFDRVTRFLLTDGSEYWGNQLSLELVGTESGFGLAGVAIQVEQVEELTLVGEEGWSDSPSLSIVRHEESIVLSWPIVNRPFLLEQGTFTDEGLVVITEDVSIVDGRNVLVLPVEVESGVYYRLQFAEATVPAP